MCLIEQLSLCVSVCSALLKYQTFSNNKSLWSFPFGLWLYMFSLI